MPSLMPELARERAESNRKVAALAEAARQRREGAPAARALTQLAITRGLEARQCWQEAIEALRGGLSAEGAREVVGLALDVTNSWLAIVRTARLLWEEAGSPAEGTEQLDAVEKEVEQARAAAARAHAFLTGPRPPIDAARLEKGRQAVAEGRFKTAEEIRSARRGAGE